MSTPSKVKEYTLREYQTEIVSRIYSAWADGKRSVMCQMPTGTGKTVVAVKIIRDWVEEHTEGTQGQIIVVAHRREILQQIRETLRKNGIEDVLSSEIVLVESIQKLARNIKDGIVGLQPDLVIVDEAHHAKADTYSLLWEAWPSALFVGMTATPSRLKQEGFTELFDILICSWPVKHFIMSGWLADYTYISVSPDSEMMMRMSSLKKRGADGDFQTKEMVSILDNRPSIEQLYSSYKKYADGRQGIIYAINREHALHIRDYYEEKGESIMLIDNRTPTKKRDKLMAAYRNGEIRIFVNCEIAGEGVDVPNVSFIQMARPTLSLNKYLQQVGRGLRPKTGQDERTIILDNVGMYYMFGLPNEDRDWEKMFRVGQILPQQDLSKSIRNLCARKNDTNLDEGHNLQMICVSQQTAAISVGRRGSLEIRPQEGYTNRFNLYLNGVPLLPYDVDIEGPMNGYIGVWRCHDKGYHKKYYDEDGTLLDFKYGEGTRLVPGGFIYIPHKGLQKYYDPLMKLYIDTCPTYKNVGLASFVLETDGWHLRNENYGHLAVIEHSIREIGNAVSLCFTEQPTIKYFVFGRNKTILRFLGFEDDATEVFCNELLPNTLFLRKDGKIVALRKDKSTKDVFAKWEKSTTENAVSEAPENYKHHFLTDSKEFHIFEENELWGWGENGEILCPPKFKNVRLHCKGLLLVDIDVPMEEKMESGRDYKSIVVDKQGNVVYDEYHVKYISENINNGIRPEGVKLEVIRPGVTKPFYILIKNNIQEYTLTDSATGVEIHYIDGYEFRYIKSKRAWTPKKYKRAAILLGESFNVTNGVFTGIERVTLTKVLSFPNDKQTFYRVKEVYERGTILEEVLTSKLFLYNNNTLEPIRSTQDYIALLRPEFVKGGK